MVIYRVGKAGAGAGAGAIWGTGAAGSIWGAGAGAGEGSLGISGFAST